LPRIETEFLEALRTQRLGPNPQIFDGGPPSWPEEQYFRDLKSKLRRDSWHGWRHIVWAEQLWLHRLGSASPIRPFHKEPT